MKGLKNMKGLKKNKKGFTLIELLAVIVILGILMLVAIPSVTRFINQSREKTFKNAAQMLIDAVRNDAVVNQVPTCFVRIEGNSVKLEKGDKTYYNGYILVTKNPNDATYTYSINVIDTKNQFRLNATENAIDAITFTASSCGDGKFCKDTAIKSNSTVSNPTTPTGISACSF